MGNLGVTQIDSARVKQQQKQKQQPAQTNQQSVSFFDEAWSGHQIAKLTGDNVVTDWLQNKDKVCTDGKDDGKLSVGQYALSFAKGLIGGIPKAIINHPLATAVTVGVGAAAVALTGGAILPVFGAIGVATGVGMAGYGTYKAATAKTDGEAKQALETMGMGVTTTALSMKSAGKMLDKAAEAGVKSAQVSKDANIFQKTWQMFKAIPESLTKSKEWTRFNLDIPIAKEFDALGRTTKKKYGDGSFRKYHYEYSCDKNCERLVNKTAPNGDYKLYDWIDHDVIEKGSPIKGTYKKYWGWGDPKEVGNTKTGEYVKYNSTGTVEEEGNMFTKTYKKWVYSNEYEYYEKGEYKGTFNKDGKRVMGEKDFWEDIFNAFKESQKRQKQYSNSSNRQSSSKSYGSYTNSATAEKVTLNDGAEKFVNYLNNKVSGGKGLSEAEMRDFAKLTGFSYEQIATIDKQTYRQLCLKYHPDRNPNNPLAERIFEIIQNLYNVRKAA